ncbi:phosphate ABC transporter permease family protein [Enterovibrio sp. Hal110]
MATVSGGLNTLHSRPAYYGSFAAILAAIPSFLLLVLWQAIEPSTVESLAHGTSATSNH